MANVNFIELYKSLDAALSQRTSPNIDFHRYNGIQLLPNNELPYVQSTSHREGIELEDWTAYVVKCDGTREEEVTGEFMVERVFTDDNGQAQIEWSLTNIPFDFGSSFVYLRIEQLVGETFYTNIFQLTENDKYEVTRVDYKASVNDTMQSIDLQMYFWQNLKNQELSSYYEISTKNTVTVDVKSQKYQRWQTKVIPNDLFIKISDVFENKYVYVDLSRSHLFEAVEIKEFENAENFAQNTFKLAFNYNDVYDPLYVAPIVNNYPSIVLNSVTANGYVATYTFTYDNFTPTYLIYEYSSDLSNWTSVTNSPNSPNQISFSETGTWYFRIKHPEATSNIIRLELGSQVVANNDSVQVEKGGSIFINPLLNDVLVGTTTITAITAATNGTSTIINPENRIQYVHDDSETTFDTFNYTISNGTTSDSASINVTITTGQSQSFSTSQFGQVTRPKACLLTHNATRYFQGDFTYVGLGDFIFEDAALTNSFDGGDLWYPINNGQAILINSLGEVTDIEFCNI